MFITFEGVEGCGKSSILSKVYEELKKEGFKILKTREPGGVKISEDIRNILLDKENTVIDKRTEALLFAASRRQHLVEKIWPALKKGEIILCDRFVDSSLAYQGAGDAIGVDEVLKINTFAIEKTFPDLTILFDIDPRIGLDRITKNANREINRLDVQKIEFYDTIRKCYLDLSKKYASRFVIIDASKSFEEVYEEVLSIIKKKLYELQWLSKK